GSVTTQTAQSVEFDRQLLEEVVEVVAGAQVLGQPAQRVDGTLERFAAVVEQIGDADGEVTESVDGAADGVSVFGQTGHEPLQRVERGVELVSAAVDYREDGSEGVDQLADDLVFIGQCGRQARGAVDQRFHGGAFALEHGHDLGAEAVDVFGIEHLEQRTKSVEQYG